MEMQIEMNAYLVKEFVAFSTFPSALELVQSYYYQLRYEME